MAQSEKIEFPGHDGGRLAARLDLPDGPLRAVALFAHCFSCSKDILAARRLAERLTDHGIGVLRFDFTGLGLSEGDFSNTNFSSNVGDLLAAVDWLDQRFGRTDLLIGHSLGGAAVIVAATRLPQVKAVATIGAPSEADHVLHNFAPHLDEIESQGEAEVSLAGRPFRIKKQFVEDVRAASVRDAAGSLRRPLLVLHSPVDETVGIDNATGLFIAARHPKSFISLDDADHLLRRKEDALYAADAIAGWASHYVFKGAPEAPGNPSSELDGAVVVEETGGGRYENRVVAGPHVFLADEPGSVGGGDRGPDPYELLSASLGACTSMTIRMYAARKGWPLEKVRVEVSHTKDHAEDCANCEDGQKVDIFERTLTITGDLDEDQRAKLTEIADKCPVHRTLHSPVVVRTRTLPAGS